MKNVIKRFLLGLGVIFLVAPAASAKGLLGVRYLNVDGGWERLENGTADDGWGVGAELNLPIPMTSINYGADGNFRFGYADVLERDIWTVEALFRTYMLPMEDGFTPFAGAGIGWVDFYEVDSSYLPLEAGIEFPLGPLAVKPFYRYVLTFSSAIDDFWSAGVRGAYWFGGERIGLTGSVIYTDYDGSDGTEGFDTGIGVRLGLVVSF